MTNIKKEIKELVIARLQTMPLTIKVTLGNLGTFNREQLISHIKQGDKVGEKIIEMELFYIKTIVKQCDATLT